MKHKVLVVDDDIALIRAVQYVAELDGYEVVTSETGGDALACYTAERPRMVFLDINLPDMTGFEVLETILELDPGAFVVIITGSDSLEMEEKALRLGAARYLAKPLDLDDVRSILSSIAVA